LKRRKRRREGEKNVKKKDINRISFGEFCGKLPEFFNNFRNNPESEEILQPKFKFELVETFSNRVF
jgi:hypothetical protein